jgi:geranylgeranyl diphosphate synthase type 3
MTWTQTVKWPKLGNTKCEIPVNMEKYFVISFMLKLYIILHCRIDDIQDNSVLRRGAPVAHKVYGLPSTINAAIYLLLTGLEKSLSFNHPEAVTLCTEQLLELYHGQGMELYWRDNCTCPSVKEYEEISKRSKDTVRAMSRI